MASLTIRQHIRQLLTGAEPGKVQLGVGGDNCLLRQLLRVPSAGMLLLLPKCQGLGQSMEGTGQLQ